MPQAMPMTSPKRSGRAASGSPPPSWDDEISDGIRAQGEQSVDLLGDAHRPISRPWRTDPAGDHQPDQNRDELLRQAERDDRTAVRLRARPDVSVETDVSLKAENEAPKPPSGRRQAGSGPDLVELPDEVFSLQGRPKNDRNVRTREGGFPISRKSSILTPPFRRRSNRDRRTGLLVLKGELERSGGAVALLGHDHFGHALQATFCCSSSGARYFSAGR